MKILTYEDYLNSTLEEIEEQLSLTYLYNDVESLNFKLFANKFAEEIGKYEDIILQKEPNFVYLNKKEKCIDTLNFFKKKARDISNF